MKHTSRATTNETMMTKRDEIATTVISTWVVIGLFLDGWAHNAGKPEDFWTPWHAVLYSGFLFGAFWSLRERARSRRLGLPVTPMPPLMRLGFVLFAVGGVADGLWHEVFGVEEDVEALLSPTHLTLMLGGLFLVSAPVRSALQRGDRTPSFRAFAPVAVSVTLFAAVIGFFLQFESAFRIDDHAIFTGSVDDDTQIHGVVAILLTNALLLGTVAWVMRHWRVPPGTFTLVFGGFALLVTALHAFDEVVLVVPALVGGVAADAGVARRWSMRNILLVTPAALWGAWFAVYHAVWGLGWSVELWTGSIVFATLTGAGLALVAPSDVTSERGSGGDEHSETGVGQPHRPVTRVLAELLT